MKRYGVVLTLLLVAGTALAAGGVKKKRPLTYEYGRVVISNYSAKANLAPVEFDHWLHRSRYTCRVCHVDIGFAMKVNATQIRAVDNMKGYYCGSCHNGRTPFENRKVFAACSDNFGKEDVKRCERCHLPAPNPKKEEAFADFLEKMPRERFGNGINWEKAEEKGAIKPMDFIEGVSLQRDRQKLAVQKDFSLEAKIAGMPDIIFSHKKHTVWNGCEVCHPDLFVGIRKGATKYSMIEIFDGKYCGACHGTVAFPLMDCQRCHTKPVQ
jgi:c(7)-type cytochrome triheme protein